MSHREYRARVEAAANEILDRRAAQKRVREMQREREQALVAHMKDRRKELRRSGMSPADASSCALLETVSLLIGSRKGSRRRG